ncbi:hypothetical protein FHX82_003729 [Amycolatopsis bartoniae]|uniref:VOC family protein n=1 Tax=Amycolatopsis bartoniae TaxID=941986 RepID=UPI001853176C|nr:VOC family protein [Amycolatopsis bartoniae]MBB2936665.1 hypothetical protein [Amycolatopsis bartoniae]
MTTDVEGASRFYGGLFGWEAVDQGAEFGGYRMCRLGERQVAGIGPAMEPGVPPNWTTYVSVADADVATKAVTAAGGRVIVEPMDIPSSGRMALFADTGGAAFGVWEPRGFAGAELVNEPGALCWNELATRHPDAAGAFYQAVFGWQAAKQPDYSVWHLGEREIGGMLTLDANWPAETPEHWMVYFAVADADAIGARAGELGGRTLVPPTDTPVGRFTVLADPQGASFSVIALAAA